MNIKILDSWLREYLKTNATPQQIAEKLSLTSVSIERIEPFEKDFVYDIEVTTNRVDLASVVGIAREAAAVLPHFNIDAKFIPPVLKKPSEKISQKVPVEIKNDDTLVNRVLAVAMDIIVKPSPEIIQKRLESTNIRSLNNVIDVTNYVMRTIGHPAHVFDYDRLNGGKIVIREAKKGEKIVTLDNKEYTLHGGDIIAEDETGRIIDLLGVMGLANSVVTPETKRILFFIDNNDPVRLRKTSMSLGIRTEAAVLNEKDIDPHVAYDAFLYGISLFQDIAAGQITSDLIDIFPNKPIDKKITIAQEKINATIGVSLPMKTSVQILEDLGFKTSITKETISALVPSYRLKDMEIEEDLIEEIARIYGYHNIPSRLPPVAQRPAYHMGSDEFYWENRVKNAMKYFGFTETYTYSMVSKDLYEGPLEEAITLSNPLTEDMVYMRKTLVPSLLQVLKDHKGRDTVSLFEIANVYTKTNADLPKETRMIAGVVQKPEVSFYHVKGIIEQLLNDLGIQGTFKKSEHASVGADIITSKEVLGTIEVLDEHIIDFEISFELLLKYATRAKVFTSLAKYPPIIEDLALVASETVETGEIIKVISDTSEYVVNVSLLDQFENTRTFHITYQHTDKNLTSEDITPIREKILSELQKKFTIELKK